MRKERDLRSDGSGAPTSSRGSRGPCGATSGPSTATTHSNSPPRPERRADAWQRRGSGERNRVDQEEEGPAGAARGEHRTTWQSGRTAAGVKPLTSTCPRGRCSDWHPAREFHVGPEPRGSTPEAVYTTAARPLPRASGMLSHDDTLAEREESIYDC
jgi:hypothetical protein